MIEVVEQAVRALSLKRPLFHSEADLQHALAWQIQLDQPSARIRLERRIATTPRVELDLLIEIGDRSLAVELKYPRSALAIEFGDEAYDLRDGARDVEAYGVVKDIWRLERLVREGVADEGCALLVTNNRGLWQPSSTRRETLWDAFRLTDGTILSGVRAWRTTEKAWPGPPIELSASYELRWRDYATVPGHHGNREFRYLLVAVLYRSEGESVVVGDQSVTLPTTASSLSKDMMPGEPPRELPTRERGRSIAVTALEDAGFAVTEGETRRNCLTVVRGTAAATVWVATRKALRYPFWVKTDWQPHEQHFACLVRLPETGAAEVYVIPTTVWEEPDGVFVSRDYVGRDSAPEWGINLSGRNLPALRPYLMPAGAAFLP